MTQQSSPIGSSMPSRQVVVVADSQAIARAAAERVQRAAAQATAARGRFSLVLAGGSTPKALYELLALAPELPWDRTDLFFGDERAVPPDHPDSNARMAELALLHQPFVPKANVHRLRGELDPVAAAHDYESRLRWKFPDVDFPSFDLVLLGLGPDGHTASLFPHSPALREQSRWVSANWVEKLAATRLTLTYPVFNAAREVLFLVAGSEKALALRQLLDEAGSVEDTPARGISPMSGTTTLLVDRAAAAELSAG